MFVPSAILESGETLSRGDHLGHRRSTIPDDLREADVDTIERLLPLAKDAARRARLADILWLRRTSAHQAAKASIDDHITAAQNLLQPQSWVFSVDMFHRALQLAAKLGRKNPEYQRAEAALIEAFEHPLAQTEPFLANHFLQVLKATVGPLVRRGNELQSGN
jgi:hypothetical protein